MGLATKKTATQAKPPVAAITAPPNAQASSSGWAKWAPAAYAVGGALLAGGAAGAAYYKREDLTEGYTWATDHMKYVGNLWNEEALKKRVESVIEVEEKLGVSFRTYVHKKRSHMQAIDLIFFTLTGSIHGYHPLHLRTIHPGHSLYCRPSLQLVPSLISLRRGMESLLMNYKRILGCLVGKRMMDIMSWGLRQRKS